MEHIESLLADEYGLAWVVYASGVVLFNTLVWLWTRRWRFAFLRYSARLVPLAVLAVPIPHSTVADLQVPAVILATAGWLVDGESVAMPAVRLLGLAAGAALVLSLLLTLIQFGWRRSRRKAAVAAEQAAGNEAAA